MSRRIVAAIVASVVIASVIAGHAQTRRTPPAKPRTAPATPESKSAPTPPPPPGSTCSPTPANVSATAARLRADNPDNNDFIRALDRAFGFDTVFLSQHVATRISRGDDVSINVLYPFAVYRFSVIEALRKREPIDRITMPDGPVVAVSPSRIDAPDIIKVIVERDGKEFAPLSNHLVATPLETRMGAKTVLHSGELVYPCAAFEPGGQVRVIAIPQSGGNIEADIPNLDRVGNFQIPADSRPASLLKLTSNDVEQRLGPATRVDGRRWTYTTSDGPFALYFDDSNTVNDVQPPVFDLRMIKR